MRTVVGQPPLGATEDREDLVRALVARPALEDSKLAGVMKSDVQRPVPSLGEPRQCAAGSGTDRAIASVDRPDDVAGEESLPARIASDAVRPLGVGEPARRA